MARKIANDKILIGVIIVGIILLVKFRGQNISIPIIDDGFFDGSSPEEEKGLQIAKDKFHGCMLKAAKSYYNESTKFFEEFAKCIKKHIGIDTSEMDNFSNYFFGEKKMFLPMKGEDDECKWLTIGIGGVASAEELFLKKYPQCSVFGADPADTGNFSSIGQLRPFGVGIEDTNIDLTVMINGSYTKKVMKVVSLTNLLDDLVKTRFVHYLTIDIEGFEYIILRELVGNGKFAHSDIVFCQIDAELHHPKFPKAHSSIKKLNAVQFMLDFLQISSPYIPIFNVPYLRHPHQKVTFVNVVDPRCKRVFKPQSYFGKK
uniref:Methyltransferase FkbM domain-containing protein n=1 Tax=Panagrolaimus davidi TaxID=227884 RepID=A0A914PMX8_9BILA